MVYKTESTTSCQYMATSYHRNKGEVENMLSYTFRICLDFNASTHPVWTINNIFALDYYPT